MSWRLPLCVAILLQCACTAGLRRKVAEEKSEQAAELARYEALLSEDASSRPTSEETAHEAAVRRAIEAHARDPKPVPEEAERHMAYGKTAFGEARDRQGLAPAAEEFQKAVDAAPWWHEAYFNLALTQEKLRRWASAAASYRLYLAAAPRADDAAAVKTKIYELEYRASSSGSEPVDGEWIAETGAPGDSVTRRRFGADASFRIQSDGRELSVYLKDRLMIEGTIAESRIKGEFVLIPAIFDNCGKRWSKEYVIKCEMPARYPAAGRVAKDGKRVFLRYVYPTLKNRIDDSAGIKAVYVDELVEYPLILRRP